MLPRDIMLASPPSGHSLRGCVLTLLASSSLLAQVKVPTTPAAQPLADYTFPTFVHGDGRQNLSAFRGQPLLIVTFADVWGQTAGIDRAIALMERHGKQGLQLILGHTTSGGTFADAAKDADLGAWAMRRYPGLQVRMCSDLIHTPWSWADLGMPPYWAVIGADGAAVATGSLEKGAKELDAAMTKAMQQFAAGWGTEEEASLRRILHHKGDLAAAHAKATASLQAEVASTWQRRVAIAEWLLHDGQWLRAKSEHDVLATFAKAVPEWAASLQSLAQTLGDPAAKRELELDGKLQAMLKPLQEKSPAKDLPKRLRDLAAKYPGASVAARVERIAKQVEQALEIKSR